MPDHPRRVVVNATPLVALAILGKLDLLRLLYREVLIPPAVCTEVLAGGSGKAGVVELKKALWIRTVELRDPRRADLLVGLDRGEAEVIALAQELDADLLILDERLGPQQARRLGFKLSGTLGTLLKAKEQGLVPAVGPLIVELRANGIRLSDEIVAEALRLAGEDSPDQSSLR